MRLLCLTSALLVLLLTSSVTSQDSTIDPSTDTEPSTDPSTDSSTEPPTDPSTEPPTDSSTEPPTDPSTEPPTDPSTEPPTDPPTNPPTDPPTEPPTQLPTTTPLPPLDLFKQTEQELQLINDILNKFYELLDYLAGASSAERRVRGARGHPASWWRAGALRPREDFSFCEDDLPDDGACHQLEKNLEEINTLVAKLEDNADGWLESDLKRLQELREELNGALVQAEEDPDIFQEQVKEEALSTVLEDVQQSVEEGSNTVHNKIEDLQASEPNDNAVVLAAVFGTLGGVVLVALVGFFGYKYVKKSKARKERRSSSLGSENIPSGGLSQENQDTSQDP